MPSACERCATVPDPLPRQGVLQLAPPLAHTIGTIRGLLARNGYPADEPARGVLSVPFGTGLEPLASILESSLSPTELRDTRSLITPADPDGPPSLADLLSVRPLATLVALVRGEWLATMIHDNRLTSHLQPIVHSGARGEIHAHECLLRGLDLDGSLLPPGRLLDVARAADMMFSLDRAARLSAIRSAVAAGLSSPDDRLFINFNPTTIYDPAYCLRSTIAAIAATELKPGNIVFEVVESDHVADPNHLLRIIEFYRLAGFKVALDDLGSGFSSLNLLARLRPDYIKLDMQLIRGVDADPYKAAIASRLLEMANDLNVETVAEGIETEAEAQWVHDHGADYMQGYLIARPSPRPASFAAAAG